MEIIIRKAVESDVQLIVESQMKMAMETENLELDRSTLSKGVMSVLNDNSKAQYYIAEVENEFVGMLMITLEWSDWKSFLGYIVSANRVICNVDSVPDKTLTDAERKQWKAEASIWRAWVLFDMTGLS